MSTKQPVEKQKPLQLKSTPESWMNVVWHNDPVMEEFFKEGVDIQDPKIRHLVSELDRRFAQLWHKVQHESNA